MSGNKGRPMWGIKLADSESLFTKWISPPSIMTLAVTLFGLFWWVAAQSALIRENTTSITRLETSIFTLNTPLSTKVLLLEARVEEMHHQVERNMVTIKEGGVAEFATNVSIANRLVALEQDVAVIREQLRTARGDIRETQRGGPRPAAEKP